MRRSFASKPARLLLLLSALTLFTGPLVPSSSAQDGPADRFENASLAWDAGDYPRALEGFLDVLRSPGGDRWLRRIALISGELWTTHEVAPDGRSIAITADGRLAAFETGERDDPSVHVVALDRAGEEVISAPGSGFAFAPDGSRGAWLAVAPDAALDEARAALEAVDAEDREALTAARERVRRLELERTRIHVADLGSGAAREIDTGGLTPASLTFTADGAGLLVAAADGEAESNQIHRLDLAGAEPRLEPITDGEGFRNDPVAVPGGRWLVYRRAGRNPLAPAARFFRGGARGFGLVDLGSGNSRTLDGAELAVSADGSTLAYTLAEGDRDRIAVLDLDGDDPLGAEPRVVVDTELDTGDLALSPSGALLAFQMMPREDWELYVVATRPADGGEGEGREAASPGADEETSGTGAGADAGAVAAETAGGDDASEDTGADDDRPEPRRLTREIQHDLAPRFLDEETLMAAKGEGRHRRSYLYDVATGEATRLFHNNTVRTIAPEYEWTASADGASVLIVSERDGDTVSPERGVYLVDRTDEVTAAELIVRLEEALVAELDLRVRGERTFAPIAAAVQEAVSEVSIDRLYRYQRDLFLFDSKYITEPGNEKAREYLEETYRSFGYEPELQWFEPTPRGRDEPVRTANVLATLRGTEDPELVYVVSSHFDSTSRGPGADDNTSGTAMLLETARVLAERPLPATVIFASFTGEEAGLLGSREFVRRAQEEGLRVVGALNNDMMGWSNDQRLDNTIRYSNRGIRDVQHAAAILFSDLITYDALYYKSTDAAAYYEAYGDIVGGIGSYPVLGNPHYHRSHDVLETMNHELIRETTRANVASIMLLASSPSRLTGLELARGEDRGVTASWEPSPESNVVGYRVRWGSDENGWSERAVTEPEARLPDLAPGTTVAVKAVNARALEGWDWASVEVPGP